MAKRPPKAPHDPVAAIEDYCRRKGKTYEELFYTGEQAAERFEVGMKCMLGRRANLTPREEAVRQDIVANITQANPGLEQVGGSWGDDESMVERRKREKTKLQRMERGGK